MDTGSPHPDHDPPGTAPPTAGTSVPPAPRHGRLPGLSESAPLLIFGAAALGFGLYLLFSHTTSFGGRIPLWAYLTMLGSIALFGGMVGASVGEGIEGLPREGDPLGDDLIVVSRQEWYALRNPPLVVRPASETAPRAVRVEPGGSAVIAPPVLQPRPARATPTPALPISAPKTSAPEPAPDWWEDALHTVPATRPKPVAATPAPDLDEVLRTLDSIADSPPARRPDPAPTAPPTTPPTAPVAPSPVRRKAPPAPMTSTPSLIDRQIDDIARGLDDLLVAPKLKIAPPVTVPAPRGECVGCRQTLDGGALRVPCESCNRPLCGGCLENASVGGHPGLCPVCAMLLDGSTAPG